jgi:hypothetical protein
MLPESVYSLLQGNPNYLTQFVLHVHEIGVYSKGRIQQYMIECCNPRKDTIVVNLSIPAWSSEMKADQKWLVIKDHSMEFVRFIFRPSNSFIVSPSSTSKSFRPGMLVLKKRIHSGHAYMEWLKPSVQSLELGKEKPQLRSVDRRSIPEIDRSNFSGSRLNPSTISGPNTFAISFRFPAVLRT